MNAKQVKINQLVYDNIGSIMLGNNTYLFVINDKDIKVIAVKAIQGKLSYVFPNMNTNNINDLKQYLVMDGVVEHLKQEISNNTFSKDELQTRLDGFKDLLINNDNIKAIFQNYDMKQFKNVYKNLLSYFDEVKTEKDKLNLDNISSFDIVDKDGFKKEYIKRTNEDGSVDILKNHNKQNFVEQFKDAQNEFASLKTDNGITNANETFDMFQKHVKSTVNLDQMSDIKNIDNEDNLRSYNAVNSNYINNNERDIVANPDNDIYVDTNSGVVMTLNY